MKVVVGSRDCPVSDALVETIVAFMATIDPQELIATRSRGTAVDAAAKIVANQLGFHCLTFQAASGNWQRDYDMVSGSDEVLAFIGPGPAEGTMHVIKAALDRGVRVLAYHVDAFGAPTFMGSDDGDEWRTPNTVLEEMWHEALGG